MVEDVVDLLNKSDTTTTDVFEFTLDVIAYHHERIRDISKLRDRTLEARIRKCVSL